MTFTESSTVEQLILDAVTRKRRAAHLTVQEAPRAALPGRLDLRAPSPNPAPVRRRDV
jgi:hypothetical protein